MPVEYGKHFLEVCSSTIFAAACWHLLNKCVEVFESLMQIREPTSSAFSSSLICYLIYVFNFGVGFLAFAISNFSS